MNLHGRYCLTETFETFSRIPFSSNGGKCRKKEDVYSRIPVRAGQQDVVWGYLLGSPLGDQG